MTKLTMPIGMAEKRIVDVTGSVSVALKLQLDGKPISTFDMRGRLKLVKFYVGDKGSQDVEVRACALLLHGIEVLVDGKISGQG